MSLIVVAASSSAAIFAALIASWLTRRAQRRGLTEELRRTRATERAIAAAFATHVRDPVLVVDASGEVVSATDGFARILGATPAALRGAAFVSLLEPEDRAGISERLRELARGVGGAAQNLPATLRHRDGSPIEVALSVDAVSTDGSRLCVLRADPRDGSLLLESRSESAESFALEVVQNIDDGVMLRAESGILFANPATERTFGVERHWIYRDFSVLFDAVGEEGRAALTPVLHGPLGARADREVRYQHVDGSTRTVRIYALPVRSRFSDALRSAILVQDITDRVAAEEAASAARSREAAARARAQVYAMVSHELRTPLNAIIGFSELLLGQKSGALNEKQQRYTTNVLNAGRHLLELINDILDVARADAGKLALSTDLTAVGPIVERAVDVLAPAADSKQIRLLLDFADGARDERLSVDERRLFQVILNLLSNAVKFTPTGGEVRACARVTATAWRLDITDTGVGIAPEDLARVFEPFERVEGRASSKQEGSGLGLTLVRRLIELHGGHVRAESAGLGHGATFVVELPRGNSAGPAVA